ERLECAQPLVLVEDPREGSEGHHRVVVRRVLEGGPREHETVHERHREAGRSALGEQPHRPALGRAVDVKPVADPRVEHRDAHRVVAVGERHVREQAAVEDVVDRSAVVATLLRTAAHADARWDVVPFLGHFGQLMRDSVLSADVRDPRLEQYARILIDTCVGVEPGWQVIVMAASPARPLVEEIASQLGARGAYALFRQNLAGIVPWMLAAPDELLETLAPIEAHALQNADGLIAIDAPENTRE